MADYQNFSNTQGYTPPNYQTNPYNPPNSSQTVQNNIVIQQSSPQVLILEKQTAYPSLSKPLALIILIVNIFIPGLGTIIMGCSSTNCSEWFCTGILQFFLTFLLIGWIWSICTGINCLSHSR